MHHHITICITQYPLYKLFGWIQLFCFKGIWPPH